MNTDDDGHLKLKKGAQLFYSKALMEIGDRPLTQLQKYMFYLGANTYRLRKNEAIPLAGFLWSVALEAWLSGAVDEQPVDEVAVDVAYQAILQVAKSAILNKKLEVLEMVSLAPMNDIDHVRSWCLSSSSEVWGDPIAGLVVRAKEGGLWLQGAKLPVPEFLRDIFSAAVDEGDVPKGLAKSTRDSSMRAVIAALIAQYPKGKPPSAKDLEKAAATVGFEISDDTIRKVISEVMEFAPRPLPK